MSHLIEVQGLCKKLGKFEMDDLSFTLPNGCIMGYIGENGAGKTTTIRLLLGLLKRDAGTIRLLGQELDQADGTLFEQIGTVMDEPAFPQYFTVAQVGRVMAGLYKSWDGGVFDQWVDRFGLVRDKKVKDLSRGMKMRLSLGVALSHHPRLLLLDEATNGLDPVARNEILDLLMEFIQEEQNGVFLSSHITSDLEKICDYIALIRNGRIAFVQEKDALLEETGVLKCGGGEFEKLDRGDLLGYHRGRFEVAALVAGRAAKEKKYPWASFEKPTLEDIMMLWDKEEDKTCEA